MLLPRDARIVACLQQPLQPVYRLLLPCFFARIGLTSDLAAALASPLWWLALAMTTAAIAGKVGGCLLAGRLTGTPSGDSLELGVLMNTRGMMELVVLNIGRELGLIAEPYFSAMLTMALATTLMTAPWLTWLESRTATAKAMRRQPQN